MVIFVLGLWLAIAFVGCAIGQSRGRPELGFFISLLVGPIGWVLVLFLPKSSEIEAIEAQRRARSEAAAGAVPQGAEAIADAHHRNLARLDAIERLHGLLQSGALTSDEYVTQKRRLLGEQPVPAPIESVAPVLTRGWHPDPQDPKLERYYNGYKWTWQSRRLRRAWRAGVK